MESTLDGVCLSVSPSLSVSVALRLCLLCPSCPPFHHSRTRFQPLRPQNSVAHSFYLSALPPSFPTRRPSSSSVRGHPLPSLGPGLVSCSLRAVALCRCKLLLMRWVGLQERLGSVQSNIAAEFGKLHESLQEREKQLVLELSQQENLTLDIMMRNLEEIQGNLTSITQKLAHIQLQMEQEDILALIKEDANEPSSEEEYRVLVAGGIMPVGIFKGPLQYSAWKQMLDIIIPGK
uniref:Uncharacterized protein n=1 Tax=Callorhinchus milii TaxID=7868 RepID=A0A4W3GQP5_CALMI